MYKKLKKFFVPLLMLVFVVCFVSVFNGLNQNEDFAVKSSPNNEKTQALQNEDYSAEAIDAQNVSYQASKEQSDINATLSTSKNDTVQVKENSDHNSLRKEFENKGENSPGEGWSLIGSEENANNSCCSVPQNANETDTSVKWSLSENGILTLSNKVGEDNEINADGLPAWHWKEGYGILKVKEVQITTPLQPTKSVKSWFSPHTGSGWGQYSQISKITGLNNLDLSKATDVSYMFCDVGNPLYPCEIDGNFSGNFDLSTATNVEAMFAQSNINAGCASTTTKLNITLNPAVTNMNYMFQGFENENEIAIQAANNAKIESLANDFGTQFMFCDALNVKKVSLPNIKLAGLNATAMFCNAKSCESIDFDKCDNNPDSTSNFEQMFKATDSLTTINTFSDADWKTVKGNNMFARAKSRATDLSIIGCNNTSWNPGKVNADYACVDRGIGSNGVDSTPGYFTANTIKAVESNTASNDTNGKKLTFYYDNHNYNTSGSGNIVYDVFPFNAATDVPWQKQTSTFSSVEFADSMNQNIPGLTSTAFWFYGFKSSDFTEINLKKLNIANVTSSVSMFEGCESLKTIYSETYYNDNQWSKVSSSDNMFASCQNLIGGNGYKWDGTVVDKTYAVSDLSNHQGFFSFDGNNEDPDNPLFVYTIYFNQNGQNIFTQTAIAGETIKIGGIVVEDKSTAKSKINVESGHSFISWKDGQNIKYADLQEISTTSGKDDSITLDSYIGENVVDPVQKGTLTYNGENQQAQWNGAENLTNVGTVEGKYATTYTAQFQPNEGYCWEGGATNPHNANWSIGKLQAEIVWDTNSYTYDKSEHKPNASVSNICSGDECSINVDVDKQAINVGSYKATATSLSNTNYILSSPVPEQSFVINKRTVSLTWGSTTLTYNATKQTPSCTAGNVCSGDSVGITVSGGETDSNAKSGQAKYVATASFSSTYENYQLPSANTTDFVINQYNLSNATIASVTTVYDQWTKTGVNKPTPAVTADKVLTSGTDFNYSYDWQTPATSGTYSCSSTVTATGISNSNYTGSKSTNFTEKRKELTITYHANFDSSTPTKTQTAYYGAPYTTKGDTYWTRTVTGNTGWNTKADGSGTKTVPGKNLATNPTANMDLYATWSQAYALLDTTNKIMTLKCDGSYSSSKEGSTHFKCTNTTGTNTPGWYNKNNGVTEITVDSSFSKCRPSGIAYWFGFSTSGCPSIQKITHLENLKVNSCKNMANLFTGAQNLKTVQGAWDNADSSLNWNTSKVEDANRMFLYVYQLQTLDLGALDMSACTNATGMFMSGSPASTTVTKIVAPKFSSNCTNMQSFCNGQKKATTIDLSSSNLSGVTNNSMMFKNCSSLQTIYASSSCASATTNYEAFLGCTTALVGKSGSYSYTWSSSYVTGAYARVAGSSRGYFSSK